MSQPALPIGKTYVAITNKRDVNITMPWFIPEAQAKYPQRDGNVIQPLINGERAFTAVYDAIFHAKHSIDIISWGFDPSMRLTPPSGPRLGELLQRKAKQGCKVRALTWKNAMANLGENNIIGDGLFGSGGGSVGIGSGVGSTGNNNASGSTDDGFNNYGAKRSGGGSAGVLAGDPDAKEFNRKWFKTDIQNLSFRTRDFGHLNRAVIGILQMLKHDNGAIQMLALSLATSHHQKMILVDYETPEVAVGFVMGHNLLRNYWDTDDHEFYSEQRGRFQPWQDLSSRIYGPVLHDLNENFCTAWEKAQPWIGSDQPIPSSRLAINPDAFAAPAARKGVASPAQICRTQPQEADRSILQSYKIALSNARNYVYFENQYFRNNELAMLLRTNRRKLKAAGWKRDFYIFVVTNVPDEKSTLTTYEALSTLGKSNLMPPTEKKRAGADSGSEKALRRSDLEGVNIHVCTLCASAVVVDPPQATYGSGTSPMGFPNMSISPPTSRTLYAPIYVHSKLLLVDDTFFTLGSANVNVRSMEADSELNISVPSPELTRQWRSHLWQLHTKMQTGDDMKGEFERWKRLMENNKSNQKTNQLLAAPLIEFFDDKKPKFYGNAD